MRARFISIPLILFGLVTLGLSTTELAGPFTVSLTSTTDTMVIIEMDGSPIALGIAGAALLLCGVAIEADLQRRRRQPPPGDHPDKT